MQYNKQHGSAAVGFAPCAVVEKPHEGPRVLKDKPCLAGRESVMQQENRVFHPFFPLPLFPPFNFFFEPSLLEPSSPGSVFHQIPPRLALAHISPSSSSSSFISFILRHIRLKITAGMPSQRRGWTWWGGGGGRRGPARQTSVTN